MLPSRRQKLDRPPLDPSHLGPALKAALRTLNRLDDDEVPARIRKLAGHSGKLPPPLAASLIAELARNDWLREKVIEQIAELDVEDARPQEAISALFLLRPDGWEDRVATLATNQAKPVVIEDGSGLEVELRRARTRIDTLTRKVDSLQAENARHLAHLAAVKKRATVPADPGTALRKRISELEAEVTELRGLHTESEARVANLMRRRSKTAATKARPATGVPTTALDLARQLDTQVAALAIAPVPRTLSAPTAPPGSRLEIPQGTRPDRAEVVEWLIAWPGSIGLAVDGWNLAYLWRTPPGKRERNRVESTVSKIGRLRRRLGAAPDRLLVFFDSSLEGDAITSRHPAVEVFFPASADQALIDLAEEGVVVVSSDRRVREECERRGAIALWSEALADWVAQ